MSNLIVRKYGLGNMLDLTVPTAVLGGAPETYSGYGTPPKLGDIMDVVDDSKATVTRYMYVQDGGSGMTAYGTYVISFSGTSGSEVKTGSVASLAVYQQVCIPQVAFTASYYGWVVIRGACKCACVGNVTANYFQEALNGTATVGTNSATLTTASVFIPTATNGGGAATNAGYMIGNRIIIA